MRKLPLVYTSLAILLTLPGTAYAQGRGQTRDSQHRTQGPASSQSREPQRQTSSRQREFHSQPVIQQIPRERPNVETYRGPNDYRAGSRPPLTVRRQDRSSNLEQYRHVYRAEQRYRLSPYRRPRGWYHQDWTLGVILPRLFWSSTYWIVNYWLYGLPVPPYGYVWVRYEDNALLIDRRTGEVVSIIYAIFY